MQRQGCAFLARLRGRSQPFCRQGPSQGHCALLGQVEALRGAAADAGAAADPDAGAGPTHLSSVLSSRDGPNAFASATVMFGDPNVDEADRPLGQTISTARHAARVALLALRGALGADRSPSALLALASVELPRSAAAAVAAALREALGSNGGPGGDPTALVGCSSRLRLPDELRGDSASLVANGNGAGSSASWRPGRGRAAAFHLTLAAAHLPGHEVHAVRCETSSLPRLPHLAEAVAGRRPPTFLLLAGGDSAGAELLNRLENLFPGSCVGAGVAAQLSAPDRRLLLVGSGGGGGGAAAASASMAGEAARGAAGASSDAAGPSGRGSEEQALAAFFSAALKRGSGADAAEASSELEGPFQRMLLDRDGAGALSGSGAAAGGRRRRPPSAAAASSPDGDAARAASAVGGEEDDGTDDEEEGEAQGAASISQEARAPQFLLVGEQLHEGGAALLAVYPRAPISAAAAAAARQAPSSPSATASGSGRSTVAEAAAARLPAKSCDLLARIALGTDHLHHVALRGAALSAISPPPSGPEPASPAPAAPENPYYWVPAAAAHPSIQVDLHQPYSSAVQGADQDPSMTRAETDDAADAKEEEEEDAEAAARAAARAAAASEAVREAVAALCNSHAGGAAAGGAGGAGEDGPPPSDAALSAMTDGLRELPLFPLEGAILFPGQTMHLRVFEKRYRELVRAATEGGGAFGLCWRGMGTTAVVRSYQSAPGGGGDIMVILEGGMRFSYQPEDLAVLPGSYGINVARRAEYALDELPVKKSDSEAMLAAARSVIDSIAGALEAATAPSVQRNARTFANALHFASGGAASTPSSTSAASLPGNASGSTTAATAASDGADGGADGNADTAVLAADVEEAKASLEPETVSLLSLYLAPHIPLHLDHLRRGWFTSRDTLWRLQQEAAWLRGNPRVCMAVASSVLRLPREHPLRIMLGLGRVAAVP